MKIKEVMTNPAVSITGEDTVCEAARVMQAHNIGAVPVVNGRQEVVGIVTDRDIVIRNTARGKDACETKVKDIMTGKVDTVKPDMDVRDAAKKMAQEKIRRIPVVEDGALIGMVALGDIAIEPDFKTEVSSALLNISQGCHKK